MQTQQPKQRDAWRRRREQYLRDSGRHVDLIREGYACGHPAKDWAVIAGRGERNVLERDARGARLFVVRRDLNLAHAGAKGSAEGTDPHHTPRSEGGRANSMKLAESTGRDLTAREAAIIQHISHVQVMAKQLRLRLPPCITFDDLVGAGTIGLIQAVDRFQASRGLQFGTYARHRIRGAMLDFLRKEDPLSRTERRRIRGAEATNCAAGEKTASATISLEWLPARELRKVPRAGCPASQIADRADLRRARHVLSARENRVISLLYELDWKNRDVARELGVNESRVSQIKRVALGKLRAGLAGARQLEG